MRMPRIGEPGRAFILEKGIVGSFDRLNRLIFLHFDGDVVGFESDISTKELKDEFNSEHILKKYLRRIEFIRSVMYMSDRERLEKFCNISSERGYRIPKDIIL